MAKMVIDKKTGRKRAVDAKASQAAKRGARKRKRKAHTAATIRKIKLGLRMARKTGKTKTGRKTKWKKAKSGAKKTGGTVKRKAATRKKTTTARKPARKSSAKARMSAGGRKGGKK